MGTSAWGSGSSGTSRDESVHGLASMTGSCISGVFRAVRFACGAAERSIARPREIPNRIRRSSRPGSDSFSPLIGVARGKLVPARPLHQVADQKMVWPAEGQQVIEPQLPLGK